MADIYTHPTTGEYLPSTTTEYLQEIVDAAAGLVAVEEHLYNIVEQARREGVAWELIGVALGVTKQGAYKRFSKPPRGRLL